MGFGRWYRYFLMGLFLGGFMSDNKMDYAEICKLNGWMMRHSKMNGTDWEVFQWFMEHVDYRTSEVNYLVANISEDVGKSRKAVLDSMNKLIEFNVLVRRSSNSFFINDSKAMDKMYMVWGDNPAHAAWVERYENEFNDAHVAYEAAIAKHEELTPCQWCKDVRAEKKDARAMCDVVSQKLQGMANKDKNLMKFLFFIDTFKEPDRSAKVMKGRLS